MDAQAKRDAERREWEGLDARTKRAVRDKIAELVRAMAHDEKERHGGPTRVSDTLGRLAVRLASADDLLVLIADVKAGAGIG